MFRRTFSQLTKAGNLLDKAKTIFGSLPENIRPKFTGKNKFTFGNFSEVELSHMQFEKDKENIQGAEFTLIAVDEACQFEWSMIEYMISRLRSQSRYKSRLIMSANPDPDHYLRVMIDWWIDEEGYPIPEREGILRYFIRSEGEFFWSNTEEELHEKYDYTDEKGNLEPCAPMSFTFISGTIRDNPIMMKDNPGYLAALKALNRIDKARLLFGNWNLREKAAQFFDREWLHKTDHIPQGSSKCRAWDKASVPPSEKNRYPDYSSCAGMAKTKQGEYIIFGHHARTNVDDESGVHGKFRKLPGERDNIISQQAEYDTSKCIIVMPEDCAAAGKFEYKETAKRLTNEGFIVKKDPAAPTAKKLKKFEPFSAACQNGLVSIIESTFDKKTLEDTYKMLECFTGEKSGPSYHDDVADCYASAFNHLVQDRMVKIVVRNQNTVRTLGSAFL